MSRPCFSACRAHRGILRPPFRPPTERNAPGWRRETPYKGVVVRLHGDGEKAPYAPRDKLLQFPGSSKGGDSMSLESEVALIRQVPIYLLLHLQLRFLQH